MSGTENVVATVAYGTAVVGYDLLKDKPEARIGRGRMITSLALTGGGVAGDCAGELWIDSEKKGTYYNTKTGDAASMTDDHHPLRTWVPAGALIQFKVIDAAPSGNMHLEIEFGAASSSGGYRRRSGNRSTANRSRSPRITRSRNSGMY